MLYSRVPRRLPVASYGKKALLLCIDPALWAEIEHLAAQDLRSANAQAEYLLREALARRGRSPVSDDGLAKTRPGKTVKR